MRFPFCQVCRILIVKEKPVVAVLSFKPQKQNLQTKEKLTN
jgi:hypothetical protein